MIPFFFPMLCINEHLIAAGVASSEKFTFYHFFFAYFILNYFIQQTYYFGSNLLKN